MERGEFNRLMDVKAVDEFEIPEVVESIWESPNQAFIEAFHNNPNFDSFILENVLKTTGIGDSAKKVDILRKAARNLAYTYTLPSSILDSQTEHFMGIITIAVSEPLDSQTFNRIVVARHKKMSQQDYLQAMKRIIDTANKMLTNNGKNPFYPQLNLETK
jgi:hypothetical protein